jgi:hypothetical protein
MKNGFAIPTLCIVLCAALYAQQASSQAGSAFDPSAFFDGNTGLPGGIEEQISIVQVPTIPQPGQGVSVQISSYSSDLNKARITWTLDGRVLSSQTGATSLQFTAPQSGETSRLVITITKEGGGTITKTIVINPAEVDLIYEADTYTHPFYKGKRLYTSESNVDFIAIPNFVRNGRKIPSSELVYTWKINGNVRQDVSGYGRSVFDT